MLTAEQILEVPAVIDAGLPADVVGQLPAGTPPAPWHSNVEMAVWSFRSGTGGVPAAGSGLASGLPVGVGAFISYLDGAVGAYREILMSPRCVKAPGAPAVLAHVPFIAVDSIPSIHGGRTNWALPKVRASFEGSPASDSVLSGEGDGWSVRAGVRAVGPWFPLRAGGAVAQPWPDGSLRVFKNRFRGRARVAMLHIEVTGPSGLSSALVSGRHLGLVFRGSVDVGAPQPTA